MTRERVFIALKTLVCSCQSRRNPDQVVEMTKSYILSQEEKLRIAVECLEIWDSLYNSSCAKTSAFYYAHEALRMIAEVK